ncbi:hypothetical protein ONZ45_g18741 [Pleurotus djamor]|nr:hypothetical protein ONZ45_g18741 [Pleurotus djamor]
MLSLAQTLRFAVLFLAVLPAVYSGVINVSKRDDDLPARVPYVFPPPGTDALADTIRSRRANGTLLDLDGVLLNAPLIASGWNAFASAIRNQNSLPGQMRELFFPQILRTAVLNSAAYQWYVRERQIDTISKLIEGKAST